MTYEEFEIQEALGALTIADKKTMLADSNLHPWIKYELNKQYPLSSMHIPVFFNMTGFTA